VSPVQLHLAHWISRLARTWTGRQVYSARDDPERSQERPGRWLGAL